MSHPHATTPDHPMSIVIPASPTDIAQWLEEDKIVLVDVREPSEYEVEHIAGALLLPLSSFEADLFPSLPGKRLVLHCARGGCAP